MTTKSSHGKLLGVTLMAVFAAVAYAVAQIPFVKSLSLSPLIVGILLGMVYANTLRARLPESWVAGLKFCTKQVLRTGIVLYGFRLTLNEVMAVGLPAIVVDCIVVCGTLALGLLLARMLKVDRETALLTSTGSAICGAAAVLGAESVVRCESHKTAVAVSTVVLFGTLSMFLYPVMYRTGLLDSLTPTQVAIYTGATLHEVAHVAGAGSAMDPTTALGIAGTATITKMIRVILLAPVLLVMGMTVRSRCSKAGAMVIHVQIPWFAFAFIAVIGLNTWLQQITGSATVKAIPFNGAIEWADTFMLTMAMTALGCDTGINKLRATGAKPFQLAALLYVWLVVGGYFLVKFIA